MFSEIDKRRTILADHAPGVIGSGVSLGSTWPPEHLRSLQAQQPDPERI